MHQKYDWLAQQTSASPQRVALIFGQEQWTFTELDQKVNRYSHGLKKLGIKQGDHIAVLLNNSPAYVFLIHALARLGAVLVPINTRLSRDEIVWQVEHSECSFLILDRLTKKLLKKSLLRSFQIISLDNDSTDTESIHLNLEEKIQDLDTNTSEFDLNDLQSIIYTSGTTGKPKGAMLSLSNHFYSAASSAFRLGILPEDRWLLCMPPNHVGGMAIVLRAAIYGIAVVLHQDFEEEEILTSIETDQVTLISLVPTMLNRLLAFPSGAEKLAKLRTILLGGASVNENILEQCRDRNLSVAVTYGLTEATSQVATAGPKQTRNKPGTVGRPLMGTKVMIIDGNGQELPSGQIGEVLVFGPTIMQGYFRQPVETKKSIINGYLHTGDLGYLDIDGDLWIVQRRVDLIISGGENVYPVEVEKVLLQHKAVEMVCVVGTPHMEWGQQVSAAIVLQQGQNPSASELIEHCRNHLAGFKIPRRIEYFNVLPHTASGKIARKKVYHLMAELLTKNLKSESEI